MDYLRKKSKKKNKKRSHSHRKKLNMNIRSKRVKNTRRNRVSRRINGGGRFGDLLDRYHAKNQECRKKCDDESKPDPMDTYSTSDKATPNGWYMTFNRGCHGYPDTYTIKHDKLPIFGINSYDDGRDKYPKYLVNIEELPNPIKTYTTAHGKFKLGRSDASDAKNLYWEDVEFKKRYPFDASSPLIIGEDILTEI